MRIIRALAAAALMIGFVLAGLTGAVNGASPPPGPAASLATGESLGGIEAWLDAPFITPDAPPGGVLQAGVTFWWTGQLALIDVTNVYVRLKPAKGKAAPTEGTVTADFPSHVLVDVIVPPGGPGTLEVGVHGQTCDSAGTCQPAEIPVPIAGTGPPTGAAPRDLLTGSIHDITDDIVVRQEFPVTVEVTPRGLWDAHDVGMPDQIAVVAYVPNDPTGVRVGTGFLQRQGAIGTPFTGMMTVRRAGSLELAVAVGGGGAPLDIAGDRKPINVLDAGISPSTGPPTASQPPGAPDPTSTPTATPATDLGIPAIVWIALAAVVAIGGGAVLLRWLADR